MKQNIMCTNLIKQMRRMQYTCVLEVDAMHVSSKVREATCWITGQITGGVLAPTDLDIKTGKNNTTESQR